MKKFLASILTLALCLGLATGCAGKQTPAENDTESAGETGVKEIPSLKIAFSPYADADQITTATEPLEQLLQAKLLEKGYDVKDIDMTVGTSYTAVGSMVYTNIIRLSMPFGVTGNVVVTGTVDNLHILTNVDWSYANKTVSFRLLRAASMTLGEQVVALRVMGKWKA